MQDLSDSHAHFDALCADIKAWEPLPTVAIDPTGPDNKRASDVWTVPLDEQILAVLIAPY